MVFLYYSSLQVVSTGCSLILFSLFLWALLFAAVIGFRDLESDIVRVFTVTALAWAFGALLLELWKRAIPSWCEFDVAGD